MTDQTTEPTTTTDATPAPEETPAAKRERASYPIRLHARFL